MHRSGRGIRTRATLAICLPERWEWRSVCQANTSTGSSTAPGVDTTVTSSSLPTVTRSGSTKTTMRATAVVALLLCLGTAAATLWDGCDWVQSNSNTAGEQSLGSAASPDDCIAKVQAQCPTATIANIHESGSGCWCQYGFNPTPDTDGYMSCVLHTLPGANATNLNFTLDHNPAQCQVAWNDGRCRELFPSDNCCAPPGRQACADLLGATGDVVETYQMVQTGKTCKDENGNPDSSEFNCYTCEAASTRRREG